MFVRNKKNLIVSTLLSFLFLKAFFMICIGVFREHVIGKIDGNVFQALPFWSKLSNQKYAQNM